MRISIDITGTDEQALGENARRLAHQTSTAYELRLRCARPYCTRSLRSIR